MLFISQKCVSRRSLFTFFSPNHFSPAVLYPLSTHALLHTNESLSSRQPKKELHPKPLFSYMTHLSINFLILQKIKIENSTILQCNTQLIIMT